jgi:hypothetical protein
VHEKTLQGNHKVRLNTQYVAVAGKDRNAVPQILATDDQGRLILGGISLPEWQTFALEYWGTTNNLKTVIYYYAEVEVARISLTYRSGGAADNDFLTGGEITLPPPP